ncbi:hypothetical protein EV132_13932 [Rhizobium sullae]|uniref:Uncharacterized protein n=1 Tax=Rhizobium sullae TaxID=50338 RepID=A0A4R3PR03_RHISU|nr:hypothetical protein EV132_13932 [Rhizobium sullae]
MGTLRFHFAVLNTGLNPFHPHGQDSFALILTVITFIGWWSETGLALLKCAMRQLQLSQLFRRPKHRHAVPAMG